MESSSPFRPVLQQTLSHALDFLEHLDNAHVGTTASYEELRGRLNLPLPEHPSDPDEIIAAIVAESDGGIFKTSSSRFFGWVCGGTLPVGIAADWLTSTWDQNSATNFSAPNQAVMEETAGRWMKELFDLPPHSTFAFTTGTQMAHAHALAIARHNQLARFGWDVELDGLFGAPAIRIIVPEERHGTIDRAVRFLGMGSNAILPVPTDADGRMTADALRDALEDEPNQPTIVVLQAGELNLGSFDPFAELIPIAHDAGAWVHIDGAFGLWAKASPTYRHLLDGVELADSWSTDGHKWLNVPYDIAYAFSAHPEDHAETLRWNAAYLHETEGLRDPHHWNMEFSRRARGVTTYAALRQLGRGGLAEMIDRHCTLARKLVLGIAALPGAELLWEPVINQGLVRFCDPRPDATREDHNRRTDEVIAAIVDSGEAMFGGTTWRGMRVMRVSVINWRTSDTDVERTIAAFERVLQA